MVDVYNTQTASSMTYPEAARIMREAVKDKAYRAFPLGGDWAAFMRWGRGSWTAATYRDYESCGDKFARTFPDLELRDFEPPVGTERLEEFMDLLWGERAPGTYNKNLTIIQQFFKFAALKGKIHGDPSLPLKRRKKRQPHREVFNEDAMLAIIANGPSADPRFMYRDKVALRLLLEWALRKGALRAIQYKHFDRARRRLTIFTKGEKVFDKVIHDDGFWQELDLSMMALGAEPEQYLMGSRRTFNRFAGYDRDTGEAKVTKSIVYKPDKPLSESGLHDWWYECLRRSGLAAEGQRSGQKMHKARHSSGQALLEEFHDIKLVQKHLGHASPTTTLETYVDYDDFALATAMGEMLKRRRSE
jgi:integrase